MFNVDWELGGQRKTLEYEFFVGLQETNNFF